MIARAPGKVVLSGAYAVLEGAPALVAAVDRYAIADASRQAVRVTPEVEEALLRRAPAAAPWFDASALRDEARGKKLGLGSSAAILVASLAALELALYPTLGESDLGTRVLPDALVAHRAAQRGGSGVDVAASALGGILKFERAAPNEAARWERVTLPTTIFVQLWSSGAEASTSAMLARVDAFAAARPGEHRRVMAALSDAARAAAKTSDGRAFIEACRAQLELLGELGALAGAPIVTDETRAFGRSTEAHSVVLPSGAGGGDVVLYMSTEPAGPEVEKAARACGFWPLPASIGAKGVHAVPRAWQNDERNEATP
jgi:phosphomevalonate kinase